MYNLHWIFLNTIELCDTVLFCHKTIPEIADIVPDVS